MKRAVFVLIVFLFFIFMTSSFCEVLWPTEKWPRSSPAEQNLDPELLKELVESIREGNEFPNQHSLLIVRNSYLVVEEYFSGNKAEDIHMLQSVSKSFTSALVGIAIGQGKIKGVDEKILDFFPDVQDIQNMDERKASIRLKDLLTMRSGTDYHESGSGSPHYQLNALPKGWDIFYLNRPMVNQPGTNFLYDSGGVILMSSLLKRRTGMHADEFAGKYLFPPLGIEKVSWFKNREGHPHTGGGMHLRPQDMAKFGLLYLREGKWEGRQIVPARWIKESFKKHVTLTRRGIWTTGYGYLWWIQPPDPDGSKKHNIYAARGAYGQFIFVIPEHDMVVVVTGRTRSGSQFRNPIEFLYSHILPAVNH